MITHSEKEILLALLRNELMVDYQTLKDVDASVSPDMFASASRGIAATSVLIGKILTWTTVDESLPLAQLQAQAYHGPKCVHDYPIAIPVDDPRNCPICTNRRCIHGTPHAEDCPQCTNTFPQEPPPNVEPTIATATGIATGDVRE